MSVRSTVLSSLLCGLALSLAGCGYSPADYCADRCDCEGCSDNELDDCVDNAEDFEERAADEGCEDQYDDLASCLGDEGTCRDGRWDEDGCEGEASDLGKCIN
jgi:hypothetical protein